MLLKIEFINLSTEYVFIEKVIPLITIILFPDLYEVGEEGDNAIYWRVAYPFPMSHRDVSFK